MPEVEKKEVKTRKRVKRETHAVKRESRNVRFDVKCVQLSYKSKTQSHSSVIARRNTETHSARSLLTQQADTKTAECVAPGWRTLHEPVCELLKLIFMTRL